MKPKIKRKPKISIISRIETLEIQVQNLILNKKFENVLHDDSITWYNIPPTWGDKFFKKFFNL